MTAEPDEGYTIGMLANQSAVTPRTIRYYVTEGLLPPPEVRGRYAVYTAEHLDRLRLIVRLKEAFLPLGEIRARLAGATHDQVRALLETPALPHAAPSISSASDYIAQALRGTTLPLREERTVTYPVAPALPTIGQAKAVDRHNSLVAPTYDPPNMVPPPSPPAVPLPAPGGEALSTLGPLRTRGGNVTDALRSATLPPPEQWQRMRLADGIELHIREPRPAWVHTVVEQLLALIGKPKGEKE